MPLISFSFKGGVVPRCEAIVTSCLTEEEAVGCPLEGSTEV